MRILRRPTLWALLALAPALASAMPGIELELVVSGLARPLGVTHAGDGSDRLFVMLQGGQVLIHEGGGLRATPFLDLSGRVSCCGEQGLLGLAFHPGYRRNGRFYVHYTARNGDSVVSRFRVSGNPDVAAAGSEEELLRLRQPFSNHNGGHLAFGPDGFLYIALGDGGSAGDPQNNAQNLDTLLGKILRVDVDGGSPYAIPAGNPFAGVAGPQDEIWAYGLRNPWRFSFDRRTGDLYIGDVGQNRFEEINFQPGRSGGGENYGWRTMEAEACFNPDPGCDPSGLTLPVASYSHADGCSVTGGFRYRGPSQPTLDRYYVYGDFCSGTIWGTRPNLAGNWITQELADSGLSISSFGEDEAGRLYVVDLAPSDGAVYRVIGRPIFGSGFESADTSEWTLARGNVAVVMPGLNNSRHALEVTVDGTRTRSFVESQHPSRERTFLARFDLNVRRVDLGGGEVEILRVGADRPHAMLTLGQEGSRYRVHLWARDGGSLREVGSTRVPAGRRVRLQVEWSAATGAGREDGEVLLRKRGRVRVSAGDLANQGLSIQKVRLGLPSGSRGAVGGSFLVDGYLSSP